MKPKVEEPIQERSVKDVGYIFNIYQETEGVEGLIKVLDKKEYDILMSGAEFEHCVAIEEQLVCEFLFEKVTK